VFGPLRSVGIGQRIMVGTLVGIGFHLFNQAFSHVGILYGLNSVFSVMFPTVLFFAVGLWLTSRVR
jgi:lipopolysaccharide export system permease protein